MRRRAIDEPEVPSQINIVPMIDVIFAILTFFIMSTLFLGRFEGLAVNLPKAQSAKPQKTIRATVTLDKQGTLYLNKSPLAIDTLSNAVRQLDEPGKDLVVVLNADGSVTHDRVVAVMDQIRQVEGAKMAIATKRQ
ncbi:biopolymer transporter ExbD [Phormidium sp. FACHB-592]|uniref:Biopolymer transporter ExbD n=1 Tax=Stenomitos frigidus AS-A4 TaxID=2933935 RepID=A0ABV0KHB5_9CYAN|nr:MULTISPECIES: biopolymer transporter ExbD [Cyanophyceae]MBD2036878.1 biopolymer transporter ExbD [Leptolyngbya sp. FACHB-321]MBD2073541.1 biopolymer transporter ExbD [Phormidium sp. FACHB-592]